VIKQTDSPRPGLSCLLLLIALTLRLAPAAAAAEGYNTLIEELDSIRVRNEVAALGLVVVRDDRLVYLATRGLADRASNRPITDDAIFRIGSISKMFTGLAAAELAARGVLDLDQAIGEFETEGMYSNPWRASYPVTTAQLLEHSAGLTDMIQAEWDYSDPRQLPLSQTLHLYPKARTLQWRPGLQHSYSNAGAGLAGYVMEEATGKPYETLMTELIFKPLALRDTSVLPPALDRLPTGYDSDGITVIPYWHQIFRPFAAVNTSLQDMGTFLRMMIRRGRLGDRTVFAAQTIERVESPTTTLAARRGLAYGYGLGNYWWLRRGIVFHGHGGDADGYLSKMGYTRANDSGYFLVITAFQNTTLRAMQAAVEQFLIQGLRAEKAPPVHTLDPAKTQQILGLYGRASWRFPGRREEAGKETLEIIAIDGQLYTQGDRRQRKRLLPVSGSLFRRQQDNRATVFVGSGADGKIYFQEDSDNFSKIDR
jgi:CubicO group peptidase (beta-lactamase class C family)